MFDFITESVENAMSVFTGDFDESQVAKMIADGMTVAAVAASLGVAEEVIQEIVGACGQ